MSEISDETMHERLKTVRPYPLVLLKAGPAYEPPDRRSPAQARVVWEHGRRNMELSADGIISLVGPVSGGFPLVGICIFTVPPEEVKAIMDGDGAVMARIFTYEVTTLHGFSGDGLRG